jgi:exodeoxyribonuclease VII small subunit
MKTENLSYENAFNELKSILDELQNDEVSVDVLTEKVKRASELLTFCNKQLRLTEKEISAVIKDLGI